MLANEQVILKVRRNPLYLTRGTVDLVLAGVFYSLYRSAISGGPFWDEWRLIGLYRNMMMEFFDQVYAIPATWTGMALLLIGLYFLLKCVRRYLHQLSTAYQFTNARVMKRSGVLGVATQELLLRSIDGVSRQQSLLGRLLGYGTLKIAGRGSEVLEWHYVSDLDAVKETLEKRLLARSSRIPTLETSADS
ncbi:MAG: PH domain-containing protein [Nitrincola lacisaponensis]|uniref:PH domain-containing protein n=1 Tax=Nitrincola lacisaponensis TaxID=267850 RepID=UPI00391D0FDF